MSSQEIIDYVMNTPHNTNPAILKQMIEASSSGNGGGTYYIIFADYVDSSGKEPYTFISDGLYDAFVKMISEYVPMSIVLWHGKLVGDNDGESWDQVILKGLYKNDNGDLETWNDNYHLFVHPDNTVEYYYDD